MSTSDGARTLRYRYRIEPDAEQRQALAKAFGCARVIYNDGRARSRSRSTARAATTPHSSWK